MAAEKPPSPPRSRLRHSIFPALKLARQRNREGQNARLSDLLERLGPNGTSILILILCLPFLVPISLGPVTMAVSTVVLALALTLLFPGFQSRLNSSLTVGLSQPVVNGLRKMAAAIARWRHRERKLPVFCLLGDRTRKIALTGMIIIHAILLALPIPLLPLANTLPALSIVLFSMAIIRRNDFHTVTGAVTTILTFIWFFLIFYLGVRGVVSVLRAIFGWEVASDEDLAGVEDLL